MIYSFSQESRINMSVSRRENIVLELSKILLLNQCCEINIVFFVIFDVLNISSRQGNLKENCSVISPSRKINQDTIANDFILMYADVIFTER